MRPDAVAAIERAWMVPLHCQASARSPVAASGVSLEHKGTAAGWQVWQRGLRLLGPLAVIAAATAVTMARRPDEFHAHYLWAEESSIVHDWLTDGWQAAFHPVQGDFMPFTAGSIGLASRVTWLYFPTLDYVAATLTFALTCALLLFPRSRWGGPTVRTGMVVFLALVPINPETYDVALYTFWWTSLWPLIVLGWEKRPGRLGFAVLAVAGLNSLAASALCIVYLIAGLRERSRSLVVAAGMLAGCLVVHATLFLRSNRHAHQGTDALKSFEQSFVNASEFVIRPVIGERPLAHLTETLLGALVLVAFLAFALLLRGGARFAALEILLVSMIYSALSSIPAPFAADPILAGGRYFFLPFAAWGILLVLIVSRAPREPFVAAAAAFALAWSLTSLPEAFARHSERIDWRTEVEKCARSHAGQYPLPVQTDGTRANAWSMWVSSDLCRRALGG